MEGAVVVGKAVVVVIAVVVVVVGAAVVVVEVATPSQVTPRTVAGTQLTLKVPFQMMVALRSTSVTKAP